MRAALEAALQDLKAQCPAVVCSRRERSLGRALPPLCRALAGILLQSERAAPGASSDDVDEEEGGSALQQACAAVGCEPAGLEAALSQLLRERLTEAAAAEAEEAGSKRQRPQADAEAPPEP